jgi:tetratricopeptide (TPR) repeat protein
VDFARAVALQQQGEHVKSVSFFRAAAEAESQRPELHVELAKALHNGSIQMGFSGHGVRYAVARSQDRARLRNDALVEIDRALELESDPRQQAAMWLIRSRVLELSGYVADARVSADRALGLVPQDPSIQALRARLDARLRAGH